MSEHNFRLPDGQPPQPGWGMVGIVVHVVVVLLLIGTVSRTVIVSRDDGPRFVHLAPSELAYSGTPAPAPTQEISTVVEEAVVVPVDSSSGIAPVTFVAPRVVPVGIPPRRLSNVNPVLGSSSPIGTSYGSGRLWVGPLESKLGIVGTSPSPEVHAARVDSAVRHRLLAFLDTVPPDSFAVQPIKPWVTEIDGQPWGIDQSWVYLGGLKLPTILLALLPMPQGNYGLAREAQELQRIREQIMQAAAQAQTNADFRRYVRAIRERRDAQRRLEGLSTLQDTIPRRIPP